MKKIAINKNLLLLLALVVLAVAGYFIFFNNNSEEPLTTTETNIPIVGAELVAELNRLNALRNIDADLFSDPAFTNLVDITQPITPQPLGRNNPFQPLGSN